MYMLTDRLQFIYQHRPDLEGENGQTGLVKASGASKSVVNQWLSGKIKSIDIRYALNIERELGISHIWLMTGDGDPFDAPLKGLIGLTPVRVGDDPDTIPIKKVNFSLRGGLDRVEIEPDLSDSGVYLMPRAIIEQHFLNPDLLVAARVRGQSMEPMMFEDDLIVVYLGDKRPVSREIYAVRFDGDLCVKQLLLRGEQWYMHSLNPDFHDVNVRSGQFEIIGRVVYQPGRLVTGRL
jgi:transcriptional regulator with XRE-family HTH domain